MAKSEDNSLGVREHVRRLVDIIAEGVYEKEQIVALSLLCAVAGENIFLLGPPGTAKSLVARRLKCAFRDARSFDYLMSRFSTPDEIFGPISISRLKESDTYERLTDGYLPSADVVFLDEIWKAGPSIQNALLTAINEHLFQNGRTAMSLPMKVLIAASNELPAPDMGLEALWDRFLVRMVSNCIVDDDGFERMLKDSEVIAPKVDDKLTIDEETYGRWRQEASTVTVSDSMMQSIKWLRRKFAEMMKRDEDGGETPDYYVSDRRWKKAFRLMQTSAYLNGRSELDCSDMMLLVHCLWNEPECREEVNRLVPDSIFQGFSDALFGINDRLRSLLSRSGGDGAGRQSEVPESEFLQYYGSYYAIENYRGSTKLPWINHRHE